MTIHKAPWGAGALACLVFAMACGGEAAGGPDIAEMETKVEDLAGHATNAHCTLFPVLLGGRVRDEIDVEGEFSMLIEGDRDLATVSFQGVHDADGLELAIEVDALRSNFSETLPIETTKSRRFNVELRGGCGP